MYLGPLDLPPGAFAFVFLLALRIIWSYVRMGLLVPATLISRGGFRPPTPAVQLLSRQPRGKQGKMTVKGVAFSVSRLRLANVDAIAVTHPTRADKWVVSLPGNGEYLLAGFGARLQLANQLGCSVIALDYRDVGGSDGLLLAADDMVEDAAHCVRFCEAQVAGTWQRHSHWRWPSSTRHIRTHHLLSDPRNLALARPPLV